MKDRVYSYECINFCYRTSRGTLGFISPKLIDHLNYRGRLLITLNFVNMNPHKDTVHFAKIVYL